MITAKAKSMFFDRKAVKDLLDGKTRSALSKAGAFVRQTARNLIRRRAGSSPVGLPPHSHAGDLRRLIYFAYDKDKQSVVIGPLPFRKGEAPRLLEFGGAARRTRKDGSAYTATYRPRPYMLPALEIERAKLPSLWAASVKD